MITTGLEKGWRRRATARALREGSLQRRPCEVCGVVESQYRHMEYGEPARLRWLCREHWWLEDLSELQRAILKEGLFAWERSRPGDMKLGLPHPGCFELKDVVTGVGDRRERCSRRSAASRSMAALAKRGFLERSARGWWRLSVVGVALARRLYPEIKPITEVEVAHHIDFYKAKESTLIARERRSSRRVRMRRRGS